MRELFLLIFTLTAGTALGQSLKVSGTFINLENNKPLVDQKVVIDQINVGVLTDENGEFEITIDSLRILKIYGASGWTGLTINLDKSIQKNTSIGKIYFLPNGISGTHIASKSRERQFFRKNLSENREVNFEILSDGAYYIIEIK